MQSRALHNSTQKTRTVHRPCKNRAAVLQENKKAMKSFDFTAFFVLVRWKGLEPPAY